LVNSLYDCTAQVITVRFMNAGAVVTETWAAHRPVIQTDRIDPNLVTDGVDGYQCKLEDIPGIADRICDLLENPEKADKMGEAGRKNIEKTFSYSTVTQDRFEVYRKHGWKG
jgi:glycosyltransferase involved in cell wall biosynthesis